MLLQKKTVKSKRKESEATMDLTFMFTQEVNAFLQYGGLVHFPCVTWQHGAKLLDEDIELVSPFLLGFVAGHAVIKNTVKVRPGCLEDKTLW